MAKSIRFKAGRAVLAMLLVAANAVILAGCRIDADAGADLVQTAPPPAMPPREIYVPLLSAPGEATEENDKAIIDFSNSSEGYVMVKHNQHSGNAPVALIDGPSGEQYFYWLDSEVYTPFTFTEGDGEYTITVCEQMEDMKLKVALRAQIDVVLEDQFAPFLRPNLFVNYSSDTKALQIAAELTAGAKDLLEIISIIYDYTTTHLTYDTEIVDKIEVGYLPDLDAVLERGKGICFDYAAVMTAMLRGLGIPTKMVFGHIDDYYHAWISVYSKEEGWIDGAIFFDGHNWKLMDPTFTSGRIQSGGDAGYFAEDTTYIAKFHY
ncbi:MAG: transglutaminase domain-containing protein [Oscillospiraceae bacterium]|nr:transglutaminase domain-containing protein [Oscillospiraceae bacterium]